MRATHHMYAYRIVSPTPPHTTIHDNDDDGEVGAGAKLAALLGMMMKSGKPPCGVFCLVSRWFGGTKLGPKRFAHISNVAREVILKLPT